MNKSLKPWTSHRHPTTRRPDGKTLVMLGEAPGAEEEAAGGTPFVGAAGKELRSIMLDAGLDPEQWHYLNVFSSRPPANELKAWTATKTEFKKEHRIDPDLPKLGTRYLKPEYYPHLFRLQDELNELKPDFIMALGATAQWALTGDSRISMGRGVLTNVPASVTISTFHPASVLRQYSQRPLVWADMRKARSFIEQGWPHMTTREVYINPTWEEMEQVYTHFLVNPDLLIGVDIETAPKLEQITTVGFATKTLGICIPLWDKYALRGEQDVYKFAKDEAKAIHWIRKFAALPNPKVTQNGLYDTQYLYDLYRIEVKNLVHDTLVMAHALQPELPKDLGTLGSLYLNEPAWKSLRQKASDENKAED